MIGYIGLTKLDTADLNVLINCYKEAIHPCRFKKRIIGVGECVIYGTCDNYCPFLYEIRVGEYLR